MTQEKRNLAKNLKDYRNSNGLNQINFSVDCGMNKDTLSLIERCKENVTLNTLHALAASMGTTVLELISPYALYILLPSEFKTEDGKRITTYGIGAMRGYEIVECYYNLTTDYQKAKAFVTLCNDLELELCHLREVAENFLQE